MTHLHPAQRSKTPTPGELRELEEKIRRYELIFKATHDVLYDLDLQNASVDWNEALYTQYGYKRTDPTDTLEWWTSHVHPDDALLLENRINELFESTDGTWQLDYRFLRADGGYNFVRDRGLLLRDGQGEPTRIIGSLLDMTAQNELDTAKDEFIALVSHQLRTPLTVIRVYGEMLTNGMFGTLSAEQTKWVHNMTNSSARLIDVVGDILNVSRMDLGRIQINPREQDLSEVVAKSVHEVLPLAEEKHVSLQFTVPRAVVIMPVDEIILNQIVHNLLTNAIRYTKAGTGKVRVRVRQDRSGWTLSVSDNGIGVPKTAQPHIFERFYRAKNALESESQGSGLGLYLIKVMCDAFGGKVWFESSAGKGTTFYVQIPSVGMTHS
jgi:PAS domain S-box-containing protein